MITRRRFASSLAALAFPMIGRGADKPALHLGLVADPQYADIEPLSTRFYRQSPDKLATAIDHFNGLELDDCINCGDAIDRDWASFEVILKVFGKSKRKFYHLLGNHDFELLDAQKERVPARLSMEQRYYSLNKPGFCLVMLDTNDVSVYAHPVASAETTQAMAAMNRFAAAGVPQAYPWNGAVGAIQLKWLDETCVKAKEANQKVIIFSHHPILPAGITHNAWNTDQLLGVVKNHRHIVAWINGHNHAGAYDLQEGAPFITMHGMVETKGTNAFATMQLFSDRFVITGHGREPSREVRFRTA